MDKTKWTPAVLFFLALSFATPALQPAYAQRQPISQILDSWVSKTEQLIVPAADVMPESQYSFAPGNGAFTGARTFGEQVKHVAAANYQLGAGILEEEPQAGTENETAPQSVKTKAEIMAYLKGSFACLRRAAASMHDSNLNEPLKKKNDRTRLGLLIDALVHSSNHYGQMVEYLRMNGIVPPASR